MDAFKEYLPLLIPYIIVELALAFAALIHVLKQTKYRFGNKIIWILVVLFFQIIGPVIYFVFGRSEE